MAEGGAVEMVHEETTEKGELFLLEVRGEETRYIEVQPQLEKGGEYYIEGEDAERLESLGLCDTFSDTSSVRMVRPRQSDSSHEGTPHEKRTRIFSGPGGQKREHRSESMSKIFKSQDFKQELHKGLESFFGDWKEDIGKKVKNLEDQGKEMKEEIKAIREGMPDMSKIEEKIGNLEIKHKRLETDIEDLEKRIETDKTGTEQWEKMNEEIETEVEKKVKTRLDREMEEESDRREKESVKKREMEEKVNDLEVKLKARNIVILGLNNFENLKMKVAGVIRDDMGTKISDSDIEKVIPLKRWIKGEERYGAKVIMANMETRRRVYKNRVKLTNRPIWVSEDLTKMNLELSNLAYTAVKAGTLKKSWSFEGEIFVKKSSDSKPKRIRNKSALDDILRKDEESVDEELS